MPKKANAAACVNRITLDAIKEVICPYEIKHAFICDVFDPLKTEGYQSIADDCSVIRSHLSEFMKGNINRQGKRQSVSTLKLWAKKISDKRIYAQLLHQLDSYGDLNEAQQQQLHALIALDRSDMPSKLLHFLEQTIEKKLINELILMLILWSVYGKDQIHLLGSVYTKGPLAVHHVQQKEAALLQHIIPPKPIFLGRDSLLEQIYQVLHQNNSSGFVFLQGMGGIGKSECAKQYARKFQDQYDTIVFAEYNGSLIHLINDNNIFSLTKPFISEKIQHTDTSYESDLEFYQRKFSQLRCSVNQRTLIILDNVDTNDDHLPDFLTGICHVIITTRWHAHTFYPNETIFVEDIDDLAVCKSIFTSYYGKSLDFDPYVEKLLTHFSGHPMALELLARQMKVSNLSSQDMLEILQSHDESSLEEGFSMLLSKKEMNFAMHIRQLFVIADLTEEELSLLKCLSLLPKKGLRRNLVKKFCGLKNYSILNHLIQRSWIRDLDGILSLHTLIQEVVQITCKPSLPDCAAFLSSFMQEFSAIDFYYANIQQKDFIFEYVSHIYTTFPEPTVEYYRIYNWIELILAHYGQYDRALQLSQKLYKLYCNAFGTTAFETARMLCRMGCSEKNRTNFQEGFQLLETGRRILRNLANPSDTELLYLSDVDVSLIDLYISKYAQTHNPDYLDTATERCEEIIAIRNSLRKQFDLCMVNCQSAYCDLTRISIFRKDYTAAEAYLAQAVQEFEKANLPFMQFYLECVRSDLALAQNQTQDAITFLNDALAIRERYFQSPTMGNHLKIRLRLAELYEKIGNDRLAIQHYRLFIHAAKDIPCYQNICDDLNLHLEELSGDTAVTSYRS